MTRSATAVTVLAIAASACSPAQGTQQSAAQSTRNTCTTDADCGENGSCNVSITPGERACWSKTYELDGLVFVVTPGALSGWNAGATYVVRDVATPMFQRNELPPLELLPPTSAQIRVVPAGAPKGATCDWSLTSNKTILARATLRTHEAAPGLPSPVYATDRVDVLGNLLVTIAPGTYDLYIEPQKAPIDPAAPKPECPIPPLLVRNVPSTATSPFTAKLSAPSTMQGAIELPPGFDMSGWRAELVDGPTGLRISTLGGVGANEGGVAPFGRLADDGTIAGPIEYYPPTDYSDGSHAHFWLRFSPPTAVAPDGTVQPTTAFPSFAFIDDVFLTPGEAMMPMLDLSMLSLAAPLGVSARLERSDSGPARAVGGRVWVASEVGGIKGVPPAIVAGFQAFADAADTGDVGRIDLTLVAGKYRGLAVGHDPALGVTPFSWEISPQASSVNGLVVELAPRPAQSFRFVTQLGTAVASAPVTLLPAPVGGEPFDAVLGIAPFSIRGGDALTTADGAVDLVLDAGHQSLVVHPDASSGYPWTIVPDVVVPTDAQTVPLTLPIELYGRIVERTGADSPPMLPSGSIQAYALAPAVTAPDGTVVVPARYVLVADAKIAARAGDAFNYRLLIPAHL